jgi:L-lactate utilization protein LutB
MKTHGATRLVKGKSMVSEEMELNELRKGHFVYGQRGPS